MEMIERIKKYVKDIIDHPDYTSTEKDNIVLGVICIGGHLDEITDILIELNHKFSAPVNIINSLWGIMFYPHLTAKYIYENLNLCLIVNTRGTYKIYGTDRETYDEVTITDYAHSLCHRFNMERIEDKSNKILSRLEKFMNEHKIDEILTALEDKLDILLNADKDGNINL